MGGITPEYPWYTPPIHNAGWCSNIAFLISSLNPLNILWILADNTGIAFANGISRDYISECNDLQIVSTKKLKNDIMVIAKFVK